MCLIAAYISLKNDYSCIFLFSFSESIIIIIIIIIIHYVKTMSLYVVLAILECAMYTGLD